MGGSLSLAIKKTSFKGCITGIVRSMKSLEEAQKSKVADKLLLEEDFLKEKLWYEYDLIIFSLPVDLTCEKINLIPDDYPGYITDLGSTKKEILDTVSKKFLHKHNYFSSHPMTGSEHSGVAFAKEDLYKGKLCILTREKNTTDDSVLHIENFWKELGSITIEITAHDHDEILSYLSHSPHILSSLLVTWANSSPIVRSYTDKSPIPLSGGGFRDMSRIAGSNPEMWEAIISTNKKEILNSLKHFNSELEILISVLENSTHENSGYWKAYFEKSKKARNHILKISE